MAEHPSPLGVITITPTPGAEIGPTPEGAQEALGNLKALREAVPEVQGVEAHRVPGIEGDAYRAALDAVLDGFGTQKDFATLLGEQQVEVGKFVEPLIEQDFLDTAVVLAGAPAEGPVARKLKGLHTRGKHPHEVFLDTRADPSIRDDVLSDRRPWPRGYGGPEVPEPKAGLPPPEEEPGLMERALEDIGEFVTGPPEFPGANIPLSLTRGVEIGLNDLMETTGLNAAMFEVDRAIRPLIGDTATEFLLMQVPVPDPQDTMTGQVVTEGARFFTKAVPVVALVAPLGAPAIINWAAGGLVAGGLRPPEEENLADVLKQVGPFEDVHLEVLREIYVEALASDESDSAFEKRLKAAVEEGILSLIGDSAMIALVKIFALGRTFVRAARDPKAQETFTRLLRDESGAVPVQDGRTAARRGEEEGIEAFHVSPNDFDEFKLESGKFGTGAAFQGFGLNFGLTTRVTDFFGDLFKKEGRTTNLFKVRLSVKENQLLQWETPLSSQSKVVKAAAVKFLINPERIGAAEVDLRKQQELVVSLRKKGAAKGMSPESIDRAVSVNESFVRDAEEFIERLQNPSLDNLTGEQFYRGLSKRFGSQKAASEALNKEGVLGTISKDTDPELLGEPSITIFSPKNVRIVEKNGAPVSAALVAAPLAIEGKPEREEFEVAGIFQKLVRPLLRAAPDPDESVKGVLGRISKGERKKRGIRWDRIYRDAVDDLHPLKRAVDDLIEKGEDLPVAQDPYKLARLNRGVNGKAEHFLEYSPFKFGTYENVGRSLKAILKDFDGRLDDVRAYAVAKRSEELRARGIETGVPEADAKATIAKLEDEIEPAFRELVEFQDHVLNYLRDSGVLSADQVKLMREANRDYVPFFRLMDDPEAKGGMGRGLQARQPIKRIKGSQRQIIDPLESIIKNTYLFINMADRNAVGSALFDLAKRHPEGDAIAKLIPPSMRPTKVTGEEALRANPEIAQLLEQYNKTAGVDVSAEDFNIFRPNTFVVARDQIAFYRDGKRILLQVDPDLADTFKALDRETVNVLVRIMGAPARLLRAGAILSPEFIARNPFRDQLSAFIFSEKGFVPFLDLARGIHSMAGKDANFQNWLKSGGPMASLVSMDRKYLQRNIRQIMGETTLGEKVVNVAKSPIEALRILSDLAERGTRVGEFIRVSGGARRVKTLQRMGAGEEAGEAIARGGFASREVTLDFGRIGAQTRSLNAIIAFFNASVQGNDKLVRSFINHPTRTTAKIAAGITLPSVILQVINRNEPGFDDIPQWQKDLFWLIRTGPSVPEGATPEQIQAVLAQSTWWRIPKPFELGIIFGSGAERIVDAILDEDPTAFDGFLASVGRGASPGFMPQIMSAPIETWANRSLFLDRPIIPADREKLLPQYQYSAYTTETAKAVGKLVAEIPFIGETRAASPSIIESWVRAWTGGLGNTILKAADFGLRKAGVLPDPVLPASTLADIPFVKGFVVRFPTAGAEGIQKFYDDYDRQTSIKLSIDAMIREGEPEEAIGLMEDALAEGDLLRLKGFRKALTEQNKLVRLIWKNPEMEPDEKRQLIDMIYFQMIEIANLGNEIIALGVEEAKAAAEVQSRAPTPPQGPPIPFRPSFGGSGPTLP